MMMNYRRIRKKNIPPRTLFFIAVIVLFLVISVIFPQMTPSLVIGINRPLFKAREFISKSASSLYLFVSGKEALIGEIHSLRSKVDEFEFKVAALRNIQAENDELRRVTLWSETRGITAALVTRPPFSPYDTFIIDAGEQNGVSLGDLALAGDHIIVGEVAEVFPGYSKVKAFSSPGGKITIVLEGSNIETVATGLGGGGFSVRVPQGIPIEVGRGVVLPSISLMVFGTIEAVEKNEADPFQTVYFKTPVNFFELRFVKIVPRGEALQASPF